MRVNSAELSGDLIMIPSDMIAPLVNVFDVPDWHARAECRMDTDLFLVRANDEGDSNNQAAREKCGDCAVRYLCQLDAVMQPATEGIWGGLDERQRAAIRAELPQQRTA